MSPPAHACLLASLSLLVLLLVHPAASVRSPGEYIAILTNGDIDDFGWSNGVNLGRVNMEKTLNISGTLWVPNVLDPTSALATMVDLVAQGYRLILSTTQAHGTAPVSAATMYPNVSFVQTTFAKSPLPNLSTVLWSGQELYFALGLFCGATTTNNRVGYVHPGPIAGPIASLNGFFSGVKYANPNAEMFAVFTDTFLDPDRAAGATRILLEEHGVDVLAGQQDDYTVQRAAIAAGLLAVGSTGYSTRDILGQNVGTSIIRDWLSVLLPYGSAMVNAPNTVFKQDYTAGFASKNTYLDIPSYLVPQDRWDVVTAGVALLQQGKKAYFCGPAVATLGVNETTGCLLNTSIFSAKILPGITQLGTYHVPLVEVSFPRTTFLAIVIIAAVFLAVTFVVGGAVAYLRESKTMVAARLLFLALVLIGCLVVYVGTILWPMKPTDLICGGRIWVTSLGATLAMGALIIKNVRIWIIYERAAKCKQVHITDMELLGWTGALMVANMVLLLVYSSAGHPHVKVLQGVEGLGKYEVRSVCANTAEGDKVLWAIIAFHIAQYFVGCLVTFNLRNVAREEFNESRPIGLCIYIVSLCMVIAGVLIGVTSSTNVQTVIIVSFSLLFGTTAVLVVLFLPKILANTATGKIVANWRPTPRPAVTATTSQSKLSHSSSSQSEEKGKTAPVEEMDTESNTSRV